MIKRILTFTFMAASFFAGAQSFSAKYNFAAITATTPGTTDPTPPPTATGATFGSFSAVGVNTVSSGGAGRFSYTDWALGSTTGVNTYSTMTGSIDLTKYYDVSITPVAGFSISLINITFDSRRSGTGIRSYAVRSSADTYTTNLPASVGTSTNLSVMGTNEFFWNFDATTSNQTGNMVDLSSLPEFQNFTNAITFRFYAWNAEANTGTFGIDTVVFNGSASIATKVGNLSFDLNSSFNVYPVPSQDGILYIENKNAMDLTKIEVLDVLGNVVLSNNPKIENRIKLNLSEMPNGNYFIRMYSGNSISTKKIAIVK